MGETGFEHDGELRGPKNQELGKDYVNYVQAFSLSPAKGSRDRVMIVLMICAYIALAVIACMYIHYRMYGGILDSRQR